MLFETRLFFFIVSLVILGVSSYTDLKKGIIPNKITFPAIFIGLALSLAASFYSNDFSYFYFTLIAVIASFIGGYALYRLGAWAGGDVKLFTAIAAFNPVNQGVLRELFGLKQAFLSSISLPVFPLTLFVYSIFAILPLGALLSIRALIERKAFRDRVLADFRKRIILAAEFSLLLVFLSCLLEFFGFQGLLEYCLLVILAAAYGIIKIKWKKIILALLFVMALSQNYFLAFNALVIFTGLVLFYALIALFIKSREEVLRRKVGMNDLAEGMIPAETIIEAGGKIVRDRGLSFSGMLGLVLKGEAKKLLASFKPKGRIIADRRKARGLTAGEIEELRALSKKGLLGNELEIKLAGPFAPTVFIAYVIANIVGDLFWFLVH